MIDQDANVGKLLLALDFVDGCSPALEAVMPPDTDPQAVAAAITEEIRAVLTKHLGDYRFVLKPPGVAVHVRTGIIKTRAEREAELQRFRENGPFNAAAMEKREREREDAINNHPNNGRMGWWRVDGIRHTAFVHADSCRSAIEKSSEIVGDWESPDATYLGEELPEVFS